MDLALGNYGGGWDRQGRCYRDREAVRRRWKVRVGWCQEVIGRKMFNIAKNMRNYKTIWDAEGKYGVQISLSQGITDNLQERNLRGPQVRLQGCGEVETVGRWRPLIWNL